MNKAAKINTEKVVKATLWALAGTMLGTAIGGYLVNGVGSSADMMNSLFQSVMVTAPAVAIAVVMKKDYFFN